ncbi:hypothetical protein HZS_2311 [Henneguya salminicola]|nr:hypothetical protein HZS_2311 [Henneguya salminicola]
MDIGTGSGYLALCLFLVNKFINKIPGKLMTIEHIDEISVIAQKNIIAAGYGPHIGREMEFIVSDGRLGLPYDAVFDIIYVGGACLLPPENLLKQLTEDGWLLAPIGYGIEQMMTIYEKNKMITFEKKIGTAIFQPLIGRLSQEWAMNLKL